MAMFVRRAAKPTLTETFDEAIKVEKDMFAIKTNPGVDTDLHLLLAKRLRVLLKLQILRRRVKMHLT